MPKLMIIDDDASSTGLIKTLLEMDGFEVTVVYRGSEALEKAREFKPDGFLIDYHLEDRSGVEVVRELRAMEGFAATPVIMASGRDVSAEADAAGADMFLIKPYDPEKLADHFNTLLGH